MVRIRRADGTTQPVDKLEAVEIVDGDGRLGMLVFNDRRDVIRALLPGDPVFTAYCRAHRLGAAQVHRHEEMPVKMDL